MAVSNQHPPFYLPAFFTKRFVVYHHLNDFCFTFNISPNRHLGIHGGVYGILLWRRVDLNNRLTDNRLNNINFNYPEEIGPTLFFFGPSPLTVLRPKMGKETVCYVGLL